ncbi:class I SAM-dependent methyltransferase [Candidatus Kaiserbacteria bacterium]|nr:class I SAM-dependent methyltransferase [Candidatus Kaiserbacteria bacterium]
MRYTQYHCGSCEVEFWWPLKNPGAKWYSNHERYGVRNADPVWGATTNHRKTLSFLSDHRGSVLDVGCGIGNFLELAKEKGWQCAGVDIDPDAIEAARKKTGISDLEVADVITYTREHPDKKFDLITFFDVLEHVDNHNEFLAAISSLLKPGGHIAMSMPYRKHALWLMKGDLPSVHLTCWDRTSLRKFLEARGFGIVHMRRSSEGVWPIVMKLRFKYGSRFSFGAVYAARMATGDTVPRPSLKRPMLVRVVHLLAKAKDAVFFGIPALIIFIAMLPGEKRYVDLFAIARKRS